MSRPFLSFLYFLRNTRTNSTIKAIHIAANTAKKIIRSHKGVSSINLVKSSISVGTYLNSLQSYVFGRNGCVTIFRMVLQF